MKKNARKHPRHPVVMKVSYQDVHRLVDYTENLSEEGIFIATTRQLAPGTELEFELSFPGLVKPIRLRGEVIWQRPAESLAEIRPPGVGVRLAFQDELERSWLRDLLKRFTAGEAKPDAGGAARRAVQVLLVEDNEKVRILFREALDQQLAGRDRTLELTVCADSGEALDRLSERHWDVVLVEWRLFEQLPAGWHGRDDGRRPLLVALGRDDADCRAALAAGVDAFVRRPVPARALLQTIASLLERDTLADVFAG